MADGTVWNSSDDARLAVRCLTPGCDGASVLDARDLFGARRHWPLEGRSQRFRCGCGGRETRVSYAAAGLDIRPDGPRLWA